MSGIVFCSHGVISYKGKTFQVHISIVPMKHEGISNKSLKEKGSVTQSNLVQISIKI